MLAKRFAQTTFRGSRACGKGLSSAVWVLNSLLVNLLIGVAAEAFGKCVFHRLTVMEMIPTLLAMALAVIG